MSDRPLYPAVFEMRVWAAAAALPGFVTVGLALADSVDRTRFAISLVVGLPIFLGLMWLFSGRKFANDLDGAVSPADARTASKAETLRRSAIVLLPMMLVYGVLAAFSPGVVGIVFGVALYTLILAVQARRYERRHGTTLLHARRYRWRGTGSRRTGRGWFDPADFFTAPNEN